MEQLALFGAQRAGKATRQRERLSAAVRTCPRCKGPTTAGEPRDLGGCINTTIRCDACGVDVFEVSRRTEGPR